MFTGQSGTSSKRVNGTIYGLSVVIIVILSVINQWTILQPQENLLHTIFWGALLLFGITGVEKFINRDKNKE